jgi:hypothetical protein
MSDLSPECASKRTFSQGHCERTRESRQLKPFQTGLIQINEAAQLGALRILRLDAFAAQGGGSKACRNLDWLLNWVTQTLTRMPFVGLAEFTRAFFLAPR